VAEQHDPKRRLSEGLRFYKVAAKGKSVERGAGAKADIPSEPPRAHPEILASDPL